MIQRVTLALTELTYSFTEEAKLTPLNSVTRVTGKCHNSLWESKRWLRSAWTRGVEKGFKEEALKAGRV